MAPEEHKTPLILHSPGIVSVTELSHGTIIHEYEAPEIAERARPGQFVQVRVGTGCLPLLPRPFSVLSTHKERGTLSILFKVFGKATSLLAEKKPGDTVGLLGPLGNSFSIEHYKNLILIAGGIGIPPVYFLCCHSDRSRHNISLFLGAASQEDIFLAREFESMNIKTHYTTEDGSLGERGLVTFPVERLLKKQSNLSNTCIAACGPLPMLAAVQKLAFTYGIDAQLSVEAVMACGIGICQGCVLPGRGERGTTCGYRLVCVEGPVFSKNDVILKND